MMESNNINPNCKMVVFSDRAYNAIIRESFAKDPLETGGILLGHVLPNFTWIVMEVLPPGTNSIFKPANFEFDYDFVYYLTQSIANQYKIPLGFIGLWHRHPGSMDCFSSPDDESNEKFSNINPYGAISGLVNIDPKFRLTMYHVSPPHIYTPVEIEVGDDIIPKHFFELKFNFGNDLNPTPPSQRRRPEITLPFKNERESRRHIHSTGNINEPQSTTEGGEQMSFDAWHQNIIRDSVKDFLKKQKKKILLFVLVICAAISALFIYYRGIPFIEKWVKEKTREVIEDPKKLDGKNVKTHEPCLRGAESAGTCGGDQKDKLRTEEDKKDD